MAWKKTEIDKELVRHISQKYNIPLMNAIVLVRRGIVEGENIKFFLETDINYLYQPFLFLQMEQAIDRILKAKEEGEKVLVFGDRDADGMVGTTIVVQSLREYGINTVWKVPLSESGYGLSLESIAKGAKEGVTLIVTIDCGISSVEEVDYANKLGIDVLIFDHHNTPQKLPDAFAIVNPKREKEQYPFNDICAGVLALKLRVALALAHTNLFKQEYCLLNVVPLQGAHRFDVMCVRNLVSQWKKSITVAEDNADMMIERLVGVLGDNPIIIYNKIQQERLIRIALGEKIDIYCEDIQKIACKHIPALKDKSLLYICENTRYFTYMDSSSDVVEKNRNEIDALFRIYQLVNFKEQKELCHSIESVIDLAALATVADIMPVMDENRIVLYNGMRKLENSPSVGIRGLLKTIGLEKKKIQTKTIGWRITPIINASGRMGEADKGVELLLETNPQKALEKAQYLVLLNDKRKKQMAKYKNELAEQAEKSLKENTDIIVVYNPKIPHTFTGILAGQFERKYNVPTIVLSERNDDVISGSMRCHHSFCATKFFERLSSWLIDFGGHKAAAGFSIPKEKKDDFLADLSRVFVEYNTHNKKRGKDSITFVDIEIPPAHFLPKAIKDLIQFFQPYGEGWSPICVLLEKVPICSCNLIGKKDEHIKMVLQIGEYKIPALLWQYKEKILNDNIIDYTALSSIKKASFIGFFQIESYLESEVCSFIVEDMLWE